MTDPTPADVGICGNASPSVVINGKPQGPAGICELPAGHPGWHRGMNLYDAWGPSYGSWGVLGDLATHTTATAAVDTDMALAKIAQLLTGTSHSLVQALEALTAYLAAGGDVATLHHLGDSALPYMRGVLQTFAQATPTDGVTR